VTMTEAMLRAHEPGVADRPRRRTFSAEYKLGVLTELDTADRSGRGAILRREGLHSSLITEWRRARDRGALDGLKTHGRPPARTAEQVENQRLRSENDRLRSEVVKLRTVVELAGKAHALYEMMLSDSAASDNG